MRAQSETLSPRFIRDRSRRPDAKARDLARKAARRAKPGTAAFLALAFA